MKNVIIFLIALLIGFATRHFTDNYFHSESNNSFTGIKVDPSTAQEYATNYEGFPKYYYLTQDQINVFATAAKNYPQNQNGEKPPTGFAVYLGNIDGQDENANAIMVAGMTDDRIRGDYFVQPSTHNYGICPTMCDVANGLTVEENGCPPHCASTGILPDDMLVIASSSLASYFCEGDYTCIGKGTSYAVGTNLRLGYYGEVCPNNLTLGDGSLWRFTGNCVCN